MAKSLEQIYNEASTSEQGLKLGKVVKEGTIMRGADKLSYVHATEADGDGIPAYSLDGDQALDFDKTWDEYDVSDPKGIDPRQKPAFSTLDERTVTYATKTYGGEPDSNSYSKRDYISSSPGI